MADKEGRCPSTVLRTENRVFEFDRKFESLDPLSADAFESDVTTRPSAAVNGAER